MKERYQHFHLIHVKFDVPLDVQAEISNWKLKVFVGNPCAINLVVTGMEIVLKTWH